MMILRTDGLLKWIVLLVILGILGIALDENTVALADLTAALLFTLGVEVDGCRTR